MESQDKIKLGLAALLVVAGVTGFYLLPADQTVLRVVLFIASLLAAAGVVWQSTMGRDFVVYAQESVAEARKVVWPARKEATQLTMLVFVFVFVLALFMWLVDSSLSWLFYDVLLRRG
ncbi:preprotein translocase subunit SecE [Vogesella sp. GCM10023246]|uniref:Protein translocase subunit SecE n=1 Tax=Vogesella oryzagri TaxID=3160864 RepID=A0ABV1M629_9NEIS